MAKTKCSICGKEMDERRDEKGKPYAVQLCSSTECQWTAFFTVTKALKKGIVPSFDKGRRKRRHKMWTEEEKQRVFDLYKQGTRQMDIAREMGVSSSTICKMIKDYREGNKRK